MTIQITISSINKMKADAQKIVMLTCYDASFAHLLAAESIDIILVGDSLGNVIQGHTTTIPVTIDEMIYHSKAIYRGNQTAFRLVDMPFGSYMTVDSALKNAVRLMQEGFAQMVKLEGAAELAPVITALAKNGIPVCAHLGLLPQHIHQAGHYRVAGRDEISAEHLIKDAILLQEAGAAMILVECIPAALTKRLKNALDVPLIGIGAGVDADGQVLVLYDILGISKGKPAKFVHNFLEETGSIQAAIKAYALAVRTGTFPDETQSY